MLTETERLAAIIESLLFVAEKPLSAAKLKNLIEVEDINLIKKAIGLLQESYQESHRGIALEQVSGGFQLRTKSENSQWILALNKAKPQRLSRAALETLAIVAYKQPLTRQEVEDIRGVDCGGVMKTLLEKDLVKIMGKKEEPGNPLIYGTTEAFLSFFGINSLKDLPSLREYAELQEEQELLPLELKSEKQEAVQEPETENAVSEEDVRASVEASAVEAEQENVTEIVDDVADLASKQAEEEQDSEVTVV